jgi:hypothetical protein
MNILGNKYGSWTIIEEYPKKINGYWMVSAQCGCGIVKLMQRSPFLHGVNSEKCFKCHLKQTKKNFMMCMKRVF